MPSAQVCGGVQKKITPNITNAGHCTVPATAAQPITTGMQPAAPPQTTFCDVRRFRPSVYTKM